MLNKYGWVMFTNSGGCKWCDKAVDLINQYSEGTIYALDVKDPEWRKTFDKLGFLTVPQVYRDGHLIGGYEALLAYFNKFIIPINSVYPPPTAMDGLHASH